MIRSFENIGIVDFRKNLEFHREFNFLFSVRCISSLLTLVFAYLWRDYTALIAGNFVQAAVRVGLSYTMSAYRPSFSLASFGSLFHFSKWMMLQGAIEVLGGQASSLVIGRMANAAAVAHYSVASEIANLATSELIAPVRRALFPGFAKIGNDRGSLRRVFLNSFAVIVLVGLPVPVGIALIAPMVVAVFLGPQWMPAVALIQVLAISGVLRTFGTSSHLIYLAIGKPRITAVLSAVRLIVIVPALILGTSQAGTIGAAWAAVVVAMLLWVVDFAILLRILRFDPSELFATAWRPIVAATLMYIVVQALPVIAAERALADCHRLAVGGKRGARRDRLRQRSLRALAHLSTTQRIGKRNPGLAAASLGIARRGFPELRAASGKMAVASLSTTPLDGDPR